MLRECCEYGVKIITLYKTNEENDDSLLFLLFFSFMFTCMYEGGKTAFASRIN